MLKYLFELPFNQNKLSIYKLSG